MIYISLTTVPVRMQLWDSFKENITSLVNQKTDREYKVILSIPYNYRNNNNEEYVISEQLQEFVKENPKLIINRVDIDYGPVVKITGILGISTNLDDILIVCDDDHVYHEDMLEYHLSKSEKYPDSAICFRGDIPIDKRYWTEDGVTKYRLRGTHFFFPVKHDSQLVIPGHWHSVCYKRKFFGDDFFDILNDSDNDDFLVGYYFKINQIDVICVSWDKETDYRGVNEDGRGGYTFPIVRSLPYPSSGFYEFRQMRNDGYGKSEQHILEMIHDNHKIFIKK